LPTRRTLDLSIRLSGLPLRPAMAIGQTDLPLTEAAR
jgi:hypothetical protein